MDAIADVNRLAVDEPPRELFTMKDALLGVGVGVRDVVLGPDHLPLEFLGPPPAGLPASPLPFAASISSQAVVFLEDRRLGCLGIRLPRQQLLEPFQFLFQLLNPRRLLPVLFGQFPNPFILVVTKILPETYSTAQKSQRPVSTKIDSYVVKAQTGGDCVQNPSDLDATYDGKKGPGSQVQIAETCVPSNNVQLITAALQQTACVSDAQAVTPMLDQLENAGRLPEELLADTLDTGDENVEAAAVRGVDLVGPVPGRAPAADPATLTVDDFALDERTGTLDACPTGHRPTSCSRNAETATTRIEMPASAGAECPFRKQCPIKQTRDGKFTLEFTDKERRLAGRRVEEETDVFAERYAPRLGIESANSGLKNRLDLGRLSVRGLKSVSRVVLHKLAGWNVLRASASQKLKTWVASRVAKTLGTGKLGGPGGLFHRWGRLIGRPVSVFCRVVQPDQRSERMLAA